MYIKSPFPDHAKVPDCNAYEAIWNRHQQAGWPDDLILHIEEKSGMKRTFQEFRTRAVLAATTLGTPVSNGSPEIRTGGNGEIVAIISDSSSVRERERFLTVLESRSYFYYDFQKRTALCSFIPCFILQSRSLCLIHTGHPLNSRMPSS